MLTSDQVRYLEEHLSNIGFGNSDKEDLWGYGSDGRIDVFGDLNLDGEGFFGIEFGIAHGSVDMAFMKIGNLKGSPRIVKGDFNCSRCSLESLKYGPKEVHGNFLCNSNLLTTLRYAPKIVGGSFMVAINKLTSIDFLPKIGKSIDLSYNPIISLKGLPENVDGFLSVAGTDIESLEWSTKTVKLHFDCSENKKIRSLKGGPKEVGGYLCAETDLTSLEGGPDLIRSPYEFLNGNAKFSCNAFELSWEEWNVNGWINVLINNKEAKEAKKLILTILTPESINIKIEDDPVYVISSLKNIWKDEMLDPIRDMIIFRDGFGEPMELSSDLYELGF